MGKPDVVIFTPTSADYRAVTGGLQDQEFEYINVTVVETGPGKLNTAAKTAAHLARIPAGGEPPLMLIGAGAAGSLNLKLRAGDAIASSSAAIGDWTLESDYARTYGRYGESAYRALSPDWADELAVECLSPVVGELADKLTLKGFLRGRLLTTDTFLTGLSGKLERGRLFNCLAGDQESGALAWVAQQYGRPWINLRVVADTLDEELKNSRPPEPDLAELLALKLTVTLSTLDRLPLTPSCAACSGCAGALKR